MTGPSFVGTATRILDFDIENRPLNYIGMDFTGGEITAIAWQVIGQRKTHCVLLGPEEWGGMTLYAIIEEFRKAYDAADMVTGHYIRGHDLPHINAACVEMGLPPLGPKLSQDTKLDLMKMRGLSKSQENLGATLGLRAPKVQMNQAYWREANRLTEEGLKRTKRRVCGDVRQHIELRQTLLNMGALGPPRVWSPGGTGGIAPYEA